MPLNLRMGIYASLNKIIYFHVMNQEIQKHIRLSLIQIQVEILNID
jgi:hypothetical protein